MPKYEIKAFVRPAIGINGLWRPCIAHKFEGEDYWRSYGKCSLLCSSEEEAMQEAELAIPGYRERLEEMVLKSPDVLIGQPIH